MKILKRLMYIFLILAILPCACRQWILEHIGAGANYQDATNLNFLGGAIANYTDVNNKMPSNITNEEGKPLLSWRVDLLRYAGGEQMELYKQFKLDEPWNSPHNMKVALKVPFKYIDPKGPRCMPISPKPGKLMPLWRMDPKALNHTPYLAVIGPKTAFGLKKLPKNKDTGYAAVVVVDKSDVFWTEPRDISVEEAKKGNALRYYGDSFARYLTPHGGPMDFDKNDPPNFEFDSEE